MSSVATNQVRRAVIDIGTNSIKLLVGDVADGQVDPVLEDSEQTRLGAGFYETHELKPQAIAQTATAVAAFADKARELKAISTRVIATSAARDAKNSHELTSAIEKSSGLKVEIISGEQEADWAFQGVTSDPELAQQPLLLLDVGGGSAEFILGQGESKHFRESFQLGTVRLLEKLTVSDPPTARELAACREKVKTFLESTVVPKLGPALKKETKMDTEHRAVQLVGTGGTTTILARMEARLNSYDRERIEATRLSLEQVQAHAEKLWALSLAERKNIVGLPKKRADVILPGVVIYEGIMETFGFKELRISTRGLRFAALMTQ
ncbi:Ppx/GppA phosphatase family protein [Pedosphaera parvula]|uniref:Ppx/GppA phosphatase n=1 Tax=Pedosphaera parvula (strain Ellin514) TaxID=320771 RepID=B9XME8_PEDPL|nr:Ppx/GppA phosphatase family protein [Pedosphaera parvula]EEF58990.1 Ppx/GppA phosphatase [Pedosphaera parvula Ellin514]